MDDKVIWRTDLRKMLGNVSGETLRKWLTVVKKPAMLRASWRKRRDANL